MNETSTEIELTDFNSTLPLNFTTRSNNTSNVTNDRNEDFRDSGTLYVMTGMLLLSIVISIVILATIKRENINGFFQWKVFDRFTVYTVVCDMIYYISISILLAYVRFKGSYPDGIVCILVGTSLTQSAMCQSMLTTITAAFVFVLVVQNRHLSTGKNDWKIFSTVFVAPLVIMVVVVLLGHVGQHRNKYCDYTQGRGFSSWHFGLQPIIIIGTFLLIVGLYLALFCYTLWKRRKIARVVKTSAVNTTRLAVNLSLLVFVHLIQFALPAVEALFDDFPIEWYRMLIASSIAGGILNGVVYFVVRKR